MHISYIDDLSITVSTNTVKRNIKIFEEEIKIIFNKGKNKRISFDLEKTELIYYTGKSKA